MFIWKEINVVHLQKNKSDLDLRKMFKVGAVTENGSYSALEIERYDSVVKVLARFEPGFEEYVMFDKKDYDLIPEIR